MTYGEADNFIKLFLKGDITIASISSTYFKMAVMEVSTLCIPSTLKAEYDGTQTDVFRLLHFEDVVVSPTVTKNVQFYIKKPPIADTPIGTDEIPIDETLALAVVFYICSYLSNKYKDRFEAKANKQISVYVSNELS